MTSGDMTYMWTKNGLNFGGHNYYGTGLRYGHRYLIRYLPTNRDFVEVFTLDNEWVCRAIRADRMTRAEIAPFLAERRAVEQDYQAIDSGVIAHRKHLAEAAAAGVMYGEEDTDYDGSAERAAVLNNPDATPSELAARADEESESDSPPTGRSARKGRPALPRVPADADPVDDPAAQDATARLASKYGRGLPPSDQPGTSPAAADQPNDPGADPDGDGPTQEDQ